MVKASKKPKDWTNLMGTTLRGGKFGGVKKSY
jgi:hypothetical protein